MNFLYWNTYWYRQDGSFKYPYWNFRRKKVQNFLEVNLFSLNKVKFIGKFIYEIQMDEKWSVDVFWLFLAKRVILRTLSTFKKSFKCTTELIPSRHFIQGPIWLYFEWYFFWSKKWQNWSELENCVNIVLITQFWIRVHILVSRLNEYSENWKSLAN